MEHTPRYISPKTARRYVENVQTKAEMKRDPTKTDIRHLIDAVLSLADQLEASQQTIVETQPQLEQFNALIMHWNELFDAMRRVGLHIWKESHTGVVYQWRDQPAVGGFATWALAMEAALSTIAHPQ